MQTIAEQLAIIRECEAAEINGILAIVGCAALAVMLAVSFGPKLLQVLNKAYHDWLHIDGFGKVFVAGAIVGLTMYGGAKHGRPQNQGADEGIAFVGFEYEVTNIVVSASVTNTQTEVWVKWTGAALPATTPVQVRMSETNEWTELLKGDPTITTGATNELYFVTSGDQSKYPYWWFGSNPPGIIIVETGIEITAFIASSSSIIISWECDDVRAVTYKVQYKRKESDAWYTAVETTENSAIISGFFIGDTTHWRVTTTFEAEVSE